MKRVIYCSLVFALSLCLNACREIVPLEDLGVVPKLVLYCFVSPQYDTIPVSLINSQPFFSSAKAISEVTNALVEISNDNQHWIQLQYDRKSKHYLWLQSVLPVVEGATYYIRASAPDYESISSSCTVPFWREVDLFPEVEFPYSPKQDYGPTAILSFSWKDYPGEENYYTAMRYGFVERGYGDYSSKDFEYYELRHENNEYVLSDAEKDGATMRMTVQYIYDYELDSSFDSLTFWDNNTKYDSVYIIFIQTDRNTFLYENSVDAAVRMEDMLFAIEPSLIFNNIKNGYGVFGAMTFKSYRINFRQKTVVEEECPKNLKH